MKKFSLGSLAVIFLLTACVTFQGEIPIEVESTTVYLSPINQDGVMDDITLPLNIPDTAGLKIKSYIIEIRSEIGEMVYSEESTDVPKGLLKRKKGVTIPEEFFWDGKSMNGDWVEDGIYQLSVQASDYNDNSGYVEPLTIIVDNTAPYAELFFPYTVFSPNGDSSQDLLDVYHKEVSNELLWTGTFQNDKGETVKEIQWPGLAPDYSWNGLSNNNTKLPEGKYSYTLKSTDEAGNSFELNFDNIQIDNTTYPVQLNLISSPAFSPNGDGKNDSVQFQVIAPEQSKIKSMKLNIVNSEDKFIKTLNGDSNNYYVFDGKGPNSTYPEGFYYAKLNVSYINGDIQNLVSEKIKLDLTAPTAVIKLSLNVFSPEGDGRKDEIEILQSSSIEQQWTGKIVKDNVTIRTWEWKERVVPVIWDGKNQADSLVPDGNYEYVLSSTDLAGNAAVIKSSVFRIDTTETPVELKQSSSIFSPNSDGISDVILFNPQPKVKTGISSWKFSILDSKNAVIFNLLNQPAQLPEQISWDGRDSTGIVKEGSYSTLLEVEYIKGNFQRILKKDAVVIDLTVPELKVSTSNLPFSPDGDGVNDTLKLTIDARDPSGIQMWNAKLLDPTGSHFFTFNPMNFVNGSYTWNGKDLRGELVQSASDYTLEVNAIDSVGNKNSVKLVIPIDILVIKDGDNLKIIISSIYFKPFTSDYLNVENDLKVRNLKTLDRLAEILQKYSQYDVQLQGHAVRIFWNNENKWKEEETDVLLPLSKDRAESIQSALIQRGIKADRLSSLGLGGYKPVVPHSDTVNRWKNRRVEFVLIK